MANPEGESNDGCNAVDALKRQLSCDEVTKIFVRANSVGAKLPPPASYFPAFSATR
jgi:hypothetical protein